MPSYRVPCTKMIDDCERENVVFSRLDDTMLCCVLDGDAPMSRLTEDIQDSIIPILFLYVTFSPRRPKIHPE